MEDLQRKLRNMQSENDSLKTENARLQREFAEATASHRRDEPSPQPSSSKSDDIGDAAKVVILHGSL